MGVIEVGVQSHRFLKVFAGRGKVSRPALQDAIQIKKIRIVWGEGQQFAAQWRRDLVVPVDDQGPQIDALCLDVAGLLACLFFGQCLRGLAMRYMDVERYQRSCEAVGVRIGLQSFGQHLLSFIEHVRHPVGNG